jgi:hypothetical protein
VTMPATNRPPLHAPESLQHIECCRCGEAADVKRKNLAGWRQMHHAARHKGQPVCSYTVKPVREVGQ